MAISATEIQQQSFGTARHGYDPQEVDIFLERLAVEVDTMNHALSEARTRIEAADARVTAAEQKAQAAARQAAAAPAASTSGVTEDQISRAFIAAQRSADALKEEARQEAEKVYRDAETRGRDIVRDALAEKQRILDEADRLRKSCERFRTEYLSLLDHFQADANKVMPGREAQQLEPAAATDHAAAMLADNDAAVAAVAQPDPTPAAPAPARAVSATPAPAVPDGSAVAAPYGAGEPDATLAPASAADRSPALLSNDIADDDLDIEEID
ncbi:MAG: DivIVA domain-containing protein [Coriobacteriales bacterium]|jgi:cell division initiation protein|nr:DivIVA domain-containing protein [Coriobacteriales bacterium]